MKVQRKLSSLAQVVDNSQCEAPKCSFSFYDFKKVGIIEKSIFDFAVTGGQKIESGLSKAIKKMKDERYPALFLIHKKEKNGRSRIGHGMAIFPDGTFIDVQKGRLWVPESYGFLHNISRIEIWKVDESIAEEWDAECGRDKCRLESNPDFNDCPCHID